jgi:tRNA threonylcarbamoyladenosine modification (KEOPS) complex  Pcc1 subunit
MKAEIEIECKDPETVIKSIKPDIEAKKFGIDMESKDGKVILTVESEDISGLLAGINSYIRLIRTAINTEGI